MNKERIINEIIQGGPLSKDLLHWINQSPENLKEYIRYKNTSALLLQGKEMEVNDVAKDFRKLKFRINSTGPGWIRNILKYAAIVIFALGAGYYFHSLASVQKDRAMNEISVPNGNRSLISLPDGSEVWLANGSSLTYPDQFSEEKREVTLSGEAFFTVAHDKSVPFFVHIGENRIRVLGTEFSVVSYPKDDEVQIDLVSGKVEFDVPDEKNKYRSYSLDPMQRLTLDQSSGNITKAEISDSFYSYWKMGTYEFKNEPFEELAKKIERLYNVKIIFDDPAFKERTFTGTFNIDDNIYSLMEVFRRASSIPFEFEIERDKILIKSLN